MSSKRPVALVTGANRGLGKEVCRQLSDLGYTVLLTSRTMEKARTAAEELGLETLVPAQLDVTDPASIDALHQ